VVVEGKQSLRPGSKVREAKEKSAAPTSAPAPSTPKTSSAADKK